MRKEWYKSVQDFTAELESKSFLRRVFAPGPVSVSEADDVFSARYSKLDWRAAYNCLAVEEARCFHALKIGCRREIGRLGDVVTDDDAGHMLIGRHNLPYLVKYYYALIEPELDCERILSGIVGTFRGRRVLMPAFMDFVRENRIFMTSAAPPGRYDTSLEMQTDGSFLYTVRVKRNDTEVRCIDIIEPSPREFYAALVDDLVCEGNE